MSNEEKTQPPADPGPRRPGRPPTVDPSLIHEVLRRPDSDGFRISAEAAAAIIAKATGTTISPITIRTAIMRAGWDDLPEVARTGASAPFLVYECDEAWGDVPVKHRRRAAYQFMTAFERVEAGVADPALSWSQKATTFVARRLARGLVVEYRDGEFTDRPALPWEAGQAPPLPRAEPETAVADVQAALAEEELPAGHRAYYEDWLARREAAAEG